MNGLMHILATDAGFWLPKGASDLAGPVDSAWNIILWVTGVFFFIVVGAMFFFIIRYRRRTPNDATAEITHNTPLEIAWTVIPLILVEVFFYVGFKGFLRYDTPASNAVVIDCTGHQWAFDFAYPNGSHDKDLYLLKDQAVRLNLHSTDVLHALYIPVFRTQRNLIPGRETQISFTPEDFSPPPGDPNAWFCFCTQYCGNGHSRMFSHVYVLAQKDFDEKMAELANPFRKKIDGHMRWVPYVDVGHTLYTQYCASCHTVDNNQILVGPPWKGLWKRDHQFNYVQAGSVDAPSPNPMDYKLSPTDSDEKWIRYLTESVLKPDAKLVTYDNKALHGMADLSAQFSGNATNDELLRAVIEYIKSIGNLQEFPYTPAVAPNSDLYDAEKYPQYHPESQAAIDARAHGTTQSQPATQ